MKIGLILLSNHIQSSLTMEHVSTLFCSTIKSIPAQVLQVLAWKSLSILVDQIESKISYNRAGLVNIPKIAGAIELLHHSNPSNSTITVKLK